MTLTSTAARTATPSSWDRMRVARWAGGLYLAYILANVLASLTGHIGLSDARTLRATIADDEAMFRVGLVAALASALLFVATAWALYTLLRPVDDALLNHGGIEPVRHTGKAKLGARVRPGWFVQTHEHPELVGRTLLEILHRGDQHRDGMGREQASRVLDRYELSASADQRFESLSGGQQARFQILLLELSGATLLLLDEPTDNLDVQSAEALEEGLESFEGTVIAVTHDRWFARGFDRFLVYGADGDVYESVGPVWDEGRVERVR